MMEPSGDRDRERGAWVIDDAASFGDGAWHAVRRAGMGRATSHFDAVGAGVAGLMIVVGVTGGFTSGAADTSDPGVVWAGVVLGAAGIVAIAFGVRLVMCGLLVSRTGVRVRRLLSTITAPWKEIERFEVGPASSLYRKGTRLVWCVRVDGRRIPVAEMTIYDGRSSVDAAPERAGERSIPLLLDALNQMVVDGGG